MNSFLRLLFISILSSTIFAGGTGYAKMNIVIKNFPIEIVKNLLPTGLVLKPYKNTPLDRHPIMFYFSKQNRVSGEFKKIPTAPYIGTFSEFAIAIPNVSHIDRPDIVYKFHNIIYLDSKMGILTARPYKLRKIFMPLESSQTSFKSIKAAKGLIKAEFYPSSISFEDEQFLEFISQNSIAISSDKKFHCSNITWKDDESKEVYFTSPKVTLAKQITSSISKDIYIHESHLTDPIEGSFYYENRWYLRKISCFK